MPFSFPIDFFDKCIPFHTPPRRPLIFLILMACAFLTAVIRPSIALADWNSTAESIRNHPTWIFTPSRAMANGKHALFIVLHGCDQTNTQLRKFGNLTTTADDNAMVIAVPDVGSRPFGPRCWNYDGANDGAGHIAELVALANDLITRPQLNIDPKHVYIVGLSSGGAMALDVGCKAPDVFAGVGSIAGPSVGSSQNSALSEATAIPATNADNAVNKCKALAGTKAAHLENQITMIAFGDMDRNGPNERFRNEQLFLESDKRNRAGQVALVSVKWAEDNVKALQKIYGTGDLGPADSVQGGLGTQRVATKNGKPRLALLVMRNIGHAWAAGTGQPNPLPPSESILADTNLSTATRGRWIALSGMNYISHAASWLIGSNAGSETVAGMPVITVTASATGNKIDLSGAATDADGKIVRVDTALFKETSSVFQQVDSHGTVPFSASNGSYSDSFINLNDARYRVQVSATDDSNHTATAIVEVALGAPPPPTPCFTESNFGHVQKGRAILCGFGLTCAKGSGDNLGLFSLIVQSSVEENPPGFFKKGICAGM